MRLHRFVCTAPKPQLLEVMCALNTLYLDVIMWALFRIWDAICFAFATVVSEVVVQILACTWCEKCPYERCVFKILVAHTYRESCPKAWKAKPVMLTYLFTYYLLTLYPI